MVKINIFFGRLLTVGPKNTVYSDEISFVFWDEIYGLYKIAKKLENLLLNVEETRI